MSPWSSMSQRVEAYLTARRLLGYALRIEGQQLKRFARFAEAREHRGAITLDLALDWAAAAPKAAAIGRARRLQTLRPLAKFCLPFAPDTQVPPPGILGPAHRRLAPPIDSEEELGRLLAAAGELGPASGLRPDTVRTLLGLLAATGAAGVGGPAPGSRRRGLMAGAALRAPKQVRQIARCAPAP